MHQWKTYFTDRLFLLLFFLHMKNFPLLLFNPSPPYSTPTFKKDDVTLDCFVPSFHPGTDFYSHVSLGRGVYDQMVITLPCFHFFLWPTTFFLTLLGVRRDQSNMCIKAVENYFESSQVFITVIPYMILWKKADYGACNYSKIVEFSVHTLRKPFKIFVGIICFGGWTLLFPLC